ncbi:leukocyte receptor cluster member 9-like [Plakobranchus ocellatus]|uniref:Leukocyte receptor cluster member 9-like n=1 Tax=Plakobranchus ocellatus TaxID=259542 RepID=A0AAV4DIM4_9GAST|nr:leukocyte receptor cluster member 9-like [Plakobranchus ocellatus]
MASSEVSGESSAAETEVAAVKASCPGRCRVVKGVGDYSHVITVQPADMDATIKFQIPGGYPREKPVIVVRSESLKPAALQAVTESLQAAAGEEVGETMLQNLIDLACAKLSAAGLKPGKSVKVSGDTDLCDTKNKKKKNKQRKQKSDKEQDDGDEKLPPMKTASDVVNRIIWDDGLEKDDFIVGYFDRFRGLMERSFSAFSWEDLASVDYDVLAVPKHRIQYFKYKDVKVWDKSRRVDNVFGSAKGTKTIDVVIREVEDRDRVEQQERLKTVHAAAEKPRESAESYSDDYEDDDDDDDDDDDGITVTIGASAGIGEHQNKDKPKEGSAELVEENGAVGGFDRFWRDKLRPNYFICVRITDPGVIEKICSVHDHLIEQEPMLAECCIPGASLHVTLCTLGLDTAQQLQMCIDALNRVQPDLQAAFPMHPLHLHGVSHFYNRVVYAKVHYKKDFMVFCDLLKTLLREAGVQIRDGYEFVPHATIMKVTRPVARERGTKNIDPKIYTPFQDAEFGHQKMDTIYLCSMDTSRRTDGFYLTPLELKFQS